MAVAEYTRSDGAAQIALDAMHAFGDDAMFAEFESPRNGAGARRREWKDQDGVVRLKEWVRADGQPIRRERYDATGRLDADREPAVVMFHTNGRLKGEAWLRHGQLHREDDAAFVEYERDGSVKRKEARIGGKPVVTIGPTAVRTPPPTEARRARPADDYDSVRALRKDLDRRAQEPAEGRPAAPRSTAQADDDGVDMWAIQEQGAMRPSLEHAPSPPAQPAPQTPRRANSSKARKRAFQALGSSAGHAGDGLKHSALGVGFLAVGTIHAINWAFKEPEKSKGKDGKNSKQKSEPKWGDMKRLDPEGIYAWGKKVGVDVSHLLGWTDEDFQNAVKTSKTWKEVMQKLGVKGVETSPWDSARAAFGQGFTHLGKGILGFALMLGRVGETFGRVAEAAYERSSGRTFGELGAEQRARIWNGITSRAADPAWGDAMSYAGGALRDSARLGGRVAKGAGGLIGDGFRVATNAAQSSAAASSASGGGNKGYKRKSRAGKHGGGAKRNSRGSRSRGGKGY